jgi:hypothetical protein
MTTARLISSTAATRRDVPDFWKAHHPRESDTHLTGGYTRISRFTSIRIPAMVTASQAKQKCAAT